MTGTHIDNVAGTRPLSLPSGSALVTRIPVAHPVRHGRAIVSHRPAAPRPRETASVVSRTPMIPTWIVGHRVGSQVMCQQSRRVGEIASW